MPGKLEQVNEDLFNVGANARVERGPRVVKSVATRELLSDANTAPHYHAPRTFKADDGSLVRVVARDAAGQPIEIGREFTYLDWNVPSDLRPWYVYRLETENPREVPEAHHDDGNPHRDRKTGDIMMKKDPNHWVESAVANTFDEAVALAQEFAQDDAPVLEGHLKAVRPKR